MASKETVVDNRVRNDFDDYDSPMGYDNDSPVSYKNNFVKGRTPQERREWLRRKGRCLNCGRHNVAQECWATSAEFFRCDLFGHLAYLCLEDSVSSSLSSSEDANGEDEDEEYAKTRATFQS